MAWFGKKDKKEKEEETKMTTLEQVRKAYEDLSDEDKQSFHQSIADRVHESIAAQERAEGDEDTQSAEAREHEALGAEHAEGKGDVAELHESDDTAEEKREDEKDEEREDPLQAILARLEALEERFKGKGDSDEEAAKKAEEVYGVGNGVFQGTKAPEEREMTPRDVAKVINKIKG